MEQEFLINNGTLLGDTPPVYQSIRQGCVLSYIEFVDGWHNVVGIVHNSNELNIIIQRDTSKLWFEVEISKLGTV